MHPRTAGILLVLALALAAFIYLYEIRGAERRADEEAESQRIFPELAASDVERISLTVGDGEEAVVERGAEGWRLVTPVEFSADAIALDGMASTLAQLSWEARVQDPEALSIYGLGVGGEVVRFRAAGRDYGLRLGIETPVGANSYVSPEDSDSVSIVPTWRVTSFRRDLDELREARILPFDRAAIEEIALAWRGGDAVLRLRDGVWWLVEPVEEPADAKAVDDLLSDLSFLRADGFVDTPPPDGEIGLDAPEFTATLTTAAVEGNGEAMRLEFALGGIYEQDFRLARGGERGLYRVAKERLGDFPRELIAYRFKTLSSFDPEAARAITLDFAPAEAAETESAAVELVRDDAGWRWAGDALAEGKGAQLLAELARLEATKIVADALGPEEQAALGLAPPRALVRVYGAGWESEDKGAAVPGPALLSEIHLGHTDPEQGILATTPESPVIYGLEPELAELLPTSYAAFRDVFVDATTGDAESSEDAPDPPPPTAPLIAPAE